MWFDAKAALLEIENEESATAIPAISAIPTPQIANIAKIASSHLQFEERSAIVEHDGSIPQEWAEGFARLCTMPQPAAYSQSRWQQIIDDAGTFIDQWAAQVAELGWSTLEVFGVNAKGPEVRFDGRGLVAGLQGRKILAVTAQTATVSASRGGTLTIRRTLTAPQDTVEPLWAISGVKDSEKRDGTQ